MKSSSVTIQMKATEQYFQTVKFVFQCSLSLKFSQTLIGFVLGYSLEVIH